ncbi:MAG: GGDEF domain-containing protein [Planctomycetes bacterium]|nr:GGDEF domain-containing protein [Planctomycetota bacterium]
MAARSSPSRAPRPDAEAAAIRWAIAGAVGIACAVVLSLKCPFPRMAPPIWALVTIGVGWLVMLVLAPWSRLRAVERRRQTIIRLARAVRRASGDASYRDLAGIVDLSADPDLAPLTKAVHEMLMRLRSDRRESRLLQRTMDDTIERETSRATSKLRRQATTDPLTGLGNRRAMERRLESFFRQDRRRSRDTLIAMIIDFDLFKNVNDTLGHEVGDRCLKFLGELLRSTLRTEDCAVRLGGDEFVLLMPDLPLHEARAVAQRLAALFGQMPWTHKKPDRPTLSIGVAGANANDREGADGLLRRADEALYRSKAAGRNSVRVAEERKAA